MEIHQDPVPLRVDEGGAIRVGDTRVLFYLVVGAYKRGASPQEIQETYETLELSDIYASIAYYLRHKDEVERHLAEVEREGAELRRVLEAGQPGRPSMRELVLARRDQMERKHAGPAE